MRTAQEVHATQENPAAQEVKEIELFLADNQPVEDLISTLLEIPEEKREEAVKMVLGEMERLKAKH